MNLSSAVIRLTDPSVEPITLDQAKAHLRFTGSSSDDEIGAMISAARARVEAFCNRPFVSASFAVLHDGALPSGNLPIRVPVAGVTEVEDVSYRDVNGVSQTFEAYTHDAERQIIEPQHLDLVPVPPSTTRRRVLWVVAVHAVEVVLQRS